MPNRVIWSSMVSPQMFESCRTCLLLMLVSCSADPAVTGGPGPTDPGAGTATQAVTVPTNDRYYGNQTWNLNLIHAPTAWSVTTGSSATLVAVIDGGKLPHPDLNAKWSGGWDFYRGTSDPTDFSMYHHSTHVAGIIGASTNNATGIAGICWGCSLMPILAEVEGPPVLVSVNAPGLADASNGTYHVLANSIRYAAGITVNDLAGHTPTAPRRADVMNISIGNAYRYHATTNTTDPCPTELQMAINDAVTAGTTVVVAAGNASGDPSHPTDAVADHYLWGTCSNVILVTAVDNTGNLAPYASTGSHVTIAAPGGAADAQGKPGSGATVECTTDPNEPSPSGTGGVFSTWAISTGGLCYRYWAGTSMATPHITGTVALMKAANPSLQPGQIAQILQKTAQHLSCSPSLCGAGLVNAGAAVQASPFAASAVCTARPGSFTCTASVTGGVAPFSYGWLGEVNATVQGTTTGASAQGGCTAGQPAWVQITVTDAVGRMSSHVTQFSCPFP